MVEQVWVDDGEDAGDRYKRVNAVVSEGERW